MIGVAGCGHIGTSLLEALLEAGANAAGFDILKQSHTVITSNIEQFATPLRRLFVVVGDASDVEALLFDTQALLQHAPMLQHIILCTSVSPAYVHTIRERVPNDIRIVDAAIVGSLRDAENRMLTFLLGGTDDDIDEVIPYLATIGQTFHRVGDLGMGMQAKGLAAAIESEPKPSDIAIPQSVLNYLRNTKPLS